MRFNLLVWADVWSHMLDLAFAFALALPIGWDREKESRSAGLRTFPLVAVASCGFVLMGNAVFGERSPDQSRLLQGLIAGIGFIGGGAVLRDGRSVVGTATAASLWNTGIMGAAVGFALYDIGIVLGLLNLATLRLLAPFKREHAENATSKQAEDRTR